jgi:hypothetical protein
MLGIINDEGLAEDESPADILPPVEDCACRYITMPIHPTRRVRELRM